MPAVVAVPVAAQAVDPSAARKRRREILASQRQTLEACPVLATPVSSDDEGEPTKKSRRVSDLADEVMADIDVGSFTAGPSVGSTTLPVIFIAANTTNTTKSAAKKPQMKYDPDVPMTKEEAAAWRREQRRKRNRESAALSRQRQRDRIADLEVEVSEWKTKVESIMDRIKKLEETSGIDSRNLVPNVSIELAGIKHLSGPALNLEVSSTAATTASSTIMPSKFVSPPVSPGRSPLVSTSLAEASPVASSSITSVVDEVVDQVLCGGIFEPEHSDKMISRHAAS
jgi:hypothetical protein